MSHFATAAAFNFVDEDMSGCLDSEEWRRFLDRFKSSVAVINMRSMFLHLDKVRNICSQLLFPLAMKRQSIPNICTLLPNAATCVPITQTWCCVPRLFSAAAGGASTKQL